MRAIVRGTEYAGIFRVYSQVAHGDVLVECLFGEVKHIRAGEYTVRRFVWDHGKALWKDYDRETYPSLSAAVYALEPL
jgi:hypothetical protein